MRKSNLLHSTDKASFILQFSAAEKPAYQHKHGDKTHRNYQMF
jgi:hypothetical protein